mgnify:CR=1 FL=1
MVKILCFLSFEFFIEKIFPNNLEMFDDAKSQVRLALDRVEEVMGVRPKGIWPPELCVGPKTMELLAKEGVEWTISDEGILSDSIWYVRAYKRIVGAQTYRRQNGYSALGSTGYHLCGYSAFWSVWYHQRSLGLYTGSADLPKPAKARNMG